MMEGEHCVSEDVLENAKRYELQKLEENKTMFVELSALEILLNDVYEKNRPSFQDYDIRTNLVCVFNQIAQEIYGDDDNYPVVKEFGSFVMDLFNASCDLDLSINFSDDKDNADRLVQVNTLKKFSRKLYKLQRKRIVSDVQLILSARVPVLKVTDCGTRVECDLSVGNLDGIVKSQIIRMISAVDERFRKLCILIKVWAKAKDINSAKDGTINSFSLILLVAFHLQTREIPILPPFSAILKDGLDPVTVNKNIQEFLNFGERNKESLAELFVSMLIKLESVNPLWLDGLCVSTYEGSWIVKRLGCSISIEDFGNRSQNTCRALKRKKKQVEIYNCICNSIKQIRLFTEQKIGATELENQLFGAKVKPKKITKVVSNPRKGKRKRWIERALERVLAMSKERSANPEKKCHVDIKVSAPQNVSQVGTSKATSTSYGEINKSEEIIVGVCNQPGEETETSGSSKKKCPEEVKVPAPPNENQVGTSTATSTSYGGINKSQEILIGVCNQLSEETSGNPKRICLEDMKVPAPPNVSQLKTSKATSTSYKGIAKPQENLIGVCNHVGEKTSRNPSKKGPINVSQVGTSKPTSTSFQGSCGRPDIPPIQGRGGQSFMPHRQLSAPCFLRGHPSSTRSEYIRHVSPRFPACQGFVGYRPEVTHVDQFRGASYIQHPISNSPALRPSSLMSPHQPYFPSAPWGNRTGLGRSHTPDPLFSSAQSSNTPAYRGISGLQPYRPHGNRPVEQSLDTPGYREISGYQPYGPHGNGFPLPQSSNAPDYRAISGYQPYGPHGNGFPLPQSSNAPDYRANHRAISGYQLYGPPGNGFLLPRSSNTPDYRGISGYQPCGSHGNRPP